VSARTSFPVWKPGAACATPHVTLG
jgi:hypothetical protein